jgi:signal transduction histidine kinase
MSSGVAIYEAIADGQDFIIKDFNGAAEPIESTPRASVLGRRLTEVFPGVKDFGLLEVLRREWRTGRPERHPAGIYRDDHICGWRENYVYRLPSGEVVAVYDDITGRKQAEEALLPNHQKLRSLAAELSLPEERERRRIAADLHDLACQSLALAKMNLQAQLEALRPSKGILEQICHALDETMSGIRNLTFDLSSATPRP